MELFNEYVDLVNFYDQHSSKPVTKTDLVPICELPEIFGLFGIQYQNKILAVGSKHLYTMQLSDGYYSISRDTHYHDLKKDVMLELPDLISEPALVFYDFSEQQQIQNEKPSTLVFILNKEIQRTDAETGTSTDETLVCYINEPLNPDNRMTILATAFTKSKLDNYINSLIRNNRLLYLNEKKLHTRDLSGIQLAKSATMPLTGASLNNIRNYRENVNEKRMNESGLFLKDIPDEEKTEHVCKTAILNNPLAFLYIPQNRISQNLIFTLIEKQNKFSFKFIPEDKFLDGLHYYFRKTKTHKKRPDIIYQNLMRLMTEKQQTMFLTEINKEKEPSIEEATRYIIEHSNNNISMKASQIPSYVQSVSDSIMSFDKNPAGVLEIIGKRFEVGQDGKPTLEGFKALSRAMEIYSDKHYETARYLFIKDGQITRHVAVSSQTPASTIIKPADSFLYELKSYARETGSRIVFLHNHPSGYVEPSGADVELTNYLSNFFTDSDGTPYFSGHIILDHGTYGLWSQESKKWNALINDSLQPISKIEETYKIQLSEYGKKVELEENGIATASLMELSEFAKECDSGNLWNTKDWVPGFLLTGNGIVTSFEQFGNFEFEDETVLCSKLKSLGRSYGSENIVLFPRSKEQFLMCERFAQDTGVVKDVYYENRDGTFELSQYNGGNIFNNARIDEIKVDDTQNYEEEALKKIKEFAHNNSQVNAESMTKEKAITDEDLSFYYDRFKKETKNRSEEIQLQKSIELALEKQAVQLQEVKLNRENWNKLFPKGTVETPIGTVKLGENQFEKLLKSDRNTLLAAMYETLSNPSMVLEKETLDEKTGDFRPVNVYGKSFVREDSNHKRIIESVIIFKDGENISIGTHNKELGRFTRQIKTADQIIYADSEISRVTSLILQNGGSHVQLKGIKTQALNKLYDKNNLLSTKDLQFSDEENTAVIREKSDIEKKENVFYTKRVNKINSKENKTMDDKTNNQEKEDLNIATYKFQSGKTLDEIIQGNSDFPVETVLLDNLIDGNIREVYKYATNEEKTVLRQLTSFRNDYDTDRKNLAVQTDCVSRWIAAKHWNPEKLEFQVDYVNHAAVAEFPYKLPWEMKEIESQVLQTENKNIATNFVLEKLKAAGIEVISDKDEFENTLAEQKGNDEIFQRMTESFEKSEKLRPDNNSVLRANEEVRDVLIEALDKTAEPLKEVVYSRENYVKIFEDGVIQSPVETIKMGTNQFVRLCPPDRNNLMGAIYETITKPSIVLEKETFDEKSESFKPVHVYGKSFINQDNDHKRAVESIIVFKDGQNIAASLHNKTISALVKQIKTADDIIYLDKEVSRVATFGLKAGDSHVVKETEEFLSSVGQKSVPLWNESYDTGKILSISDLIAKGEIEGGKLEITKDNFDKYFNIFNQNVRNYKDKPNKIASDLFTFYVKPENKQEMKQWLESQGYKISEKNEMQKSVLSEYTVSDGTTYGFAYNGKIYLNPNFADSNVAVHEYTHLWDAYTQRTNPELWSKGKESFKSTHIWQDVKSDPNYADISNNDDLILSEVHSRICGKMAQEVLERIAKEDGEIAKDRVIDWDKEVNEYLFSDLGLFSKDSIGNERSFIEEFMSLPVKDLFNENRRVNLNSPSQDEILDNGIESIQSNSGMSEANNRQNRKQEHLSLDEKDVVSEESVSDKNKKNYFTYNDFTFIPVRKFGEDEKQFLNSITEDPENTKLLTKNAVFYAGFLEKQKPIEEQNFEKSLKVFNKDDFLQSSNSDAEIFYCKEKGTFYTANNENFLVPLELTFSSEKQEKDLFGNRFSDEIKQFKSKNFDFLKNIKPYNFDEKKDFELMSDISDVLAEGEVFTKTNENIDGEIKVKLGDLFDKKNPEKVQPTGLRHLIKHRMEERLNKGISVEDAQKETTAILFLAINNIDKAPAVKEPNGKYAVYNDGIKTLIGKDKNGKFVVTGFDDLNKEEEARDSIGTVIARYGYTPGFLEIYDQVGAQLPFLNIHTKNSPVNEKENHAEKSQSKEFEQLKTSFDSLQSKFNDVLNQNNELRKEIEMLRSQQTVSDEKSANESISQGSKKQEMSDSQRSSGGMVNTSFNRETAFRSNTKVPAFGHYNEQTGKVDIIENAIFERKIEDKNDNSMNKIVLDIPHENGEHTQLTIYEREYNKMINAVEKLEEVKRTISDDTWEWVKAHQDYNKVMNLDRNMYRLNTPSNFIHNFRVHCIKEFHNPDDAMKIAALMVQDMTPNDKKGFNRMRKDYDSQYGKGAYDRLLLQEFEEISKEKEISPELLQSDFTNGFTILKGMNKELNELKKGQEINGTHIKVGDTIPLSLKCKSMDGKRIIIPLADYKIEKVTQNMLPNRAVLVNTKTNAIEIMPLNDLVAHIRKVEKKQTKEVGKEMKKQHREYGYEGR